MQIRTSTSINFLSMNGCVSLCPLEPIPGDDDRKVNKWRAFSSPALVRRIKADLSNDPPDDDDLTHLSGRHIGNAKCENPDVGGNSKSSIYGFIKSPSSCTLSLSSVPSERINRSRRGPSMRMRTKTTRRTEEKLRDHQSSKL